MNNNRLVIIQYNKIKSTINSSKTVEQLDVCRNMINSVSKWWVSERPLVKPFDFNYELEPNQRISELEKHLLNKRKEIVNFKVQ